MREPLHALGHALLVLLYTSGVAWVLFNGPRIFGRMTSFWAPLAVLMLFVVSATIVGSLVLGRPILLYLDAKKNGSPPESVTVAGGRRSCDRCWRCRPKTCCSRRPDG